jgi:hypothetical protein
MSYFNDLIPLYQGLTPNSPLKPIDRGLAVVALSDSPRTLKGVEVNTSIISENNPTQTHFNNGCLYTFPDKTALLSYNSVLYPAPFEVVYPVTPSNLLQTATSLSPWTLESGFGGALDKITPGYFVPAYKSGYLSSISSYETDIFQDFSNALFYAVSSLYITRENSSLKWRSQPILPNGELNPPSIKIVTHLTQSININFAVLRKSEEIINWVCADLQNFLPTIPGQTLRDGVPAPIEFLATKAPKMTSAHEKMNAEQFPYLQEVRHSIYKKNGPKQE